MAHRETDSEVCLRTPKRVFVYGYPEPTDDGFNAFIQSLGYAVEAADALEHAVSELEQRDFPVVLVRTDATGRGLDFVERAHLLRTSIFVAVTSCAGCDSAVKSLRAGARDYVVWPHGKEEIEFALKRAFEEVEKCRFRDDMLNMLIHDIKIPLSSILGYSALIFDKETGAVREKSREFIKVIRSNGLKILQLIDNFLTNEKIDSGKLHLNLDDVDIGLFLQDLAHTFEAQFERHNLQLDLEIEPGLAMVEADEGLLFRAVGNLLSNASKFALPGTRVLVTAHFYSGCVGKCENGGVLIGVVNEGPGLSAEEIPEIFERFRRGHSQGSIEGSGLGAYVVKSIVEAHGGKVWVESVPNGLTSFYVCLPFTVV